MPREIDPFQGKLQAPSHLQQDDPERKGNPQTSIQDIVQEGVSRVVVGLTITPKGVALKEIQSAAIHAYKQSAVSSQQSAG